MRWIGALVAAAALLLAGCGSAGDSAEDVLESFRTALADTAYTPSFQRCVIKEVEDVYSSEEFRDLDEPSQRRKGVETAKPAFAECREKASGPIVEADATSAELASIRESFAEGIAEGAIEGGMSPAQARCVERGIDALPAAKFIELVNTLSPSAQAKQLLPLFKSCRS